MLSVQKPGGRKSSKSISQKDANNDSVINWSTQEMATLTEIFKERIEASDQKIVVEVNESQDAPWQRKC